MATVSCDPRELNFMSLVPQSSGSYRSPQPHCLLYPANYSATVYPPSSLRAADKSAASKLSNSASVSVLTSAAPILPHSTVAMATSSSMDTSNSSGDYKVRTHELIPSPHCYYEVLELLGKSCS